MSAAIRHFRPSPPRRAYVRSSALSVCHVRSPCSSGNAPIVVASLLEDQGVPSASLRATPPQQSAFTNPLVVRRRRNVSNLAPRPSGAPTSGHQARSGGARYIFASRAWRAAVVARLARALGPDLVAGTSEGKNHFRSSSAKESPMSQGRGGGAAGGKGGGGGKGSGAPGGWPSTTGNPSGGRRGNA